MQNRHLSNYY